MNDKQENVAETTAVEAVKPETPAAKPHDLKVSPMARVLESAAGYEIRLDVPGTAEKDVQINVEDRILTIDAIREDAPFGASRLIREEFPLADYRAVYELPDRVDVEGIRAHLANGVLTLTLPKRDEARPRHILVNAA